MYIKVVVHPKSKEEKLTVVSPDHLDVKVKPKAERNEANERMREMVAFHFGVPIGKIRIVSGHHHPHKIISVDV